MYILGTYLIHLHTFMHKVIAAVKPDHFVVCQKKVLVTSLSIKKGLCVGHLPN